MSTALDKVKAWLETEDIRPGRDRLLLALSGGPDSVALLCILHELGFALTALHMNYGLRGAESDADAEFCTALCAALNIPLKLRKAESEAFLRGSSVQQVARDLRYVWFENELESREFAFLALGHHRDDRVETLLWSFFRGAVRMFPRDLPARRCLYIRPMLDVSREEILEYLQERGQDYREDSSNKKTDYMRNYIRHKVMPVLRKLNPSVSERMLEWQEKGAEMRAFVQAAASAFAEQWVTENERNGELRIDLDAASAALPPEALRFWLQTEMEARGLHGEAIQRIVELARSGPGAMWEGGGLLMQRGHGALFVLSHAEDRFFQRPVLISGVDALPQPSLRFLGHTLRMQVVPAVEVGDLGAPGVHYLDLAAIRWPLTLRTWQNGDRMVPLGMTQSRRLSDIFVDQKVPVPHKRRAVVFEDARSIVCLSGFRIADHVKMNEETNELLRIELYE